VQYQEPTTDSEESPSRHGIALVRNGRAIAWIPAISASDPEVEEVE